MCFGDPSPRSTRQAKPATESGPRPAAAPQILGDSYTSAEYNAYHSQYYQTNPSLMSRLFESRNERVGRQVAANVWEGLAKDTQISAGIGTGPPDPDAAKAPEQARIRAAAQARAQTESQVRDEAQARYQTQLARSEEAPTSGEIGMAL